jgi:cytochrome c peroxidase
MRFLLLLARRKKRWNGPLQYEDRSGQLMMLPGDMALLWDKKFKKFVDLYAKDEEAFFKVGEGGRGFAMG